tara:strand:+ start:1752 stop:1940 length:189 start_codon:yes stop_codon:yes gene_type:complete
MGKSKGNLGRRVPARQNNPPSKARNPKWWKSVENIMMLHPLYHDRREYEQQKKQQKKQQKTG